eukprot:TRINITY_DN30960_c0_g1_i1.p2 TRINITY_DN30960_c0_g1~~TRINITY_DN30960_c0_g1_i1.p2  ORF type:complete len:213 (-),score=11.72 TRINITY_DN30960_c0_g1_i1:126-764(-)
MLQHMLGHEALFKSGRYEDFAGNAQSRAYILAMLLNPLVSLHLIRLPASQFKGLSALGSLSMDSMAWHTETKVQAGVHFDLSISRHTSPVLKCMFGWNTRASKVAVGGIKGQSAGTSKRTLNVPPWQGVSPGPCKVHFHRRTLDSLGSISMPVKSELRLKSLNSARRRALVLLLNAGPQSSCLQCNMAAKRTVSEQSLCVRKYARRLARGSQ